MTSPLDQAVARADAARDARRWREAAKSYAEALRLAPERADLHVQHGHALKESGDVRNAEAAYRRALELAPDVADMKGMDVVGATLPGTPFVVLGRTPDVAWGFTNTGPDVRRRQASNSGMCVANGFMLTPLSSCAARCV